MFILMARLPCRLDTLSLKYYYWSQILPYCQTSCHNRSIIAIGSRVNLLLRAYLINMGTPKYASYDDDDDDDDDDELILWYN